MNLRDVIDALPAHERTRDVIRALRAAYYGGYEDALTDAAATIGTKPSKARIDWQAYVRDSMRAEFDLSADELPAVLRRQAT